MTITAEETTVALEPHDWYVTHTVRLSHPTITLRVRLRRNAYDHQSTAVVEALSTMDVGWTILHVLQPSEWADRVPTVAAVRSGKSTAQDVEDAAMIVVALMLGYVSRLLGIG